jgi:hypothetical protein
VSLRCRVDHSDAAHDTDKNPLRSFILSNVVRIGFLAQLVTLAKSICLAIVDIDPAISRIVAGS